ncbi:biotin-dependent carboxyltransferase family protein [Xylophilus sp. GOD-11R]|uniref:5-oxoprolinase subunit C family protein n=1 Tax=Xylophilus sp. GOD-11R TaxID=3089814 RepID=UPI00298BE715|nr:biotin-dependent carboxyltransferase family protein [Xylophilus sp. GOD-11R]WPB55646.1 biotin-dependent carboxyltransferase family protein [Xylophilus sp. GOD-11R]
MSVDLNSDACMLVERPGMYSLLQDNGRLGHQRIGVPVNGPMDEWSHRLANALVGNEAGAAVLECTLTGPRVSFSQDTLIALCGADLQATAAGRPVPLQRAMMLRAGTVLDFGARRAGARVYLAVRGGFATEPVLGSRATYVRGGLGGFEGRALRKGDRVPLGKPPAAALPLAGLLRDSGLPMLADLPRDPVLPDTPAGQLRFVPGPHWSQFTDQAQQAFTGTPYALTQESDRMGNRLRGAALQLRAPLELVSEATVFGTVQVPPDGQPIVLMADRQSAGGYPKIGYVCSADLPALAQSLPGDALRFTPVTQDAAERLWLDFETRLGDACKAAVHALR